MTPNGKHQAQCRICEKVVTEFPMLDIPIIGEPDSKAKKVLTIMATHVGMKHRDQFQAGAALVTDFQAFLILSQFTTGDPSIQARAETIRAGLAALSRKFTINDQQLQDAIVKLDTSGQLTADNVLAFVRQIRDVLSESGQYAPKIETPQSSLIV